MNWDEQVIKLGGHFYQSDAWAKFQEAQGYNVLRHQGNGWLWQASLRRGRGRIKYLYAAYGPALSAGGEEALDSLLAAGRQHGADFVKVEPWQSVKLGANALSAPWREVAGMQPKHIMRLDISVSEDQLRQNISQSNRNLINQAGARGLELKISSDPADLGIFMQQQKITAKRAGFTIHPDSYYRKLAQTLMPLGIAKFYYCMREGELVASALCYDFGGVRYYAHAGTDDELNRQHKGAIALLWWIVADAKASGLHTFDYGGVAPEGDDNHPWAGHTRFKRSVGGEIIELAGTWDYPLKPGKYRLYRAAKKVLPI